MKLHLTRAEGNELITGYGEGWVEINSVRYEKSLVVMPDKVIPEWPAKFEDLTAQDFEKLAELKPEVVLLGTGATHRFIHPKLTAALTAIGVSVECMDTAAACRTYNILMSEG
ncbi:MAG TPA: Mth938-like domain-containing protein, partial [Methylophilaceae bacterium]|nr:Mth938-like domain-containing protein [Methylophilaceae bacterium]